MPKRRLSDLEGSDNQEAESDNAQDATINGTVVLNLARVVFSRQAKYLKIRREHLAPVMNKSLLRGQFNLYIKSLNEELEKLLGLHLVQNGTEFHLLSSLKPESKDILHELFKDDQNTSGNNLREEYASSKPPQSRTPVVGNNRDCCLGGIQLIVIFLIVLNQNRISETDLLDSLASFGLTSRLNVTIPLFNTSIQPLIAEMVRKDYIEKSGTRTVNQEDSNGEYSLGKRCLQEFPPKTLQALLKVIVPSEDFNEKINTSLRRCFPDFDVSEPSDQPQPAEENRSPDEQAA